MSFTVTSNNRVQVKRALRLAGVQDVSNLTMAQLQAALDECLADGRVNLDMLQSDSQHSRAEKPAERQGLPDGYGSVHEADEEDEAQAIAAAVAAALAKRRSPGMDKAAIMEMIRTEVEKARVTPAVLHVQVADKRHELPGRQHKAFADILKAAAVKVNGKRNAFLLVGPAGSGKTSIARNVAEGLGVDFHYTGAVLSKYELLGHTTATGEVVRTPFRDAFENGGLFLWDELDGSDPKALVAFNAAIDNGICAFPDKVVKAHEDFIVIATANTWGNGATADYVGRNKLDAATVNRFVAIHVDYDEDLERDLAGGDPAAQDWCRYVQRIRKAAATFGVKRIISPRQTIQGVTLLAAGWHKDKVAETVLFAGMDAETARKLRASA